MMTGWLTINERTDGYKGSQVRYTAKNMNGHSFVFEFVTKVVNLGIF